MTVVAFDPIPSIHGSIKFLASNPSNKSFELDIEALEYYPASTGGCDGPMKLSTKEEYPLGLHTKINRGKWPHNLYVTNARYHIGNTFSLVSTKAVHHRSSIKFSEIILYNET